MKSLYAITGMGVIALYGLLVADMAQAYTGIGTGYYGDGKVIKEEPSPAYDRIGAYESFSVTDDVVTKDGFIDRETTTFDCIDNVFGEKTCSERRW